MYCSEDEREKLKEIIRRKKQRERTQRKNITFFIKSKIGKKVGSGVSWN
jgi:hypothetical protein